MPQLKIPYAAPKTWCRQINIIKKKKNNIAGILKELLTFVLLMGVSVIEGFPQWLIGKEFACIGVVTEDCGFGPWVGKIPMARTSLSIQTAASRTLLVTMTPGCPGAAWRGAPPHPPSSATSAAPSPLPRQPSSMRAPPTGQRAFSLDH